MPFECNQKIKSILNVEPNVAYNISYNISTVHIPASMAVLSGGSCSTVDICEFTRFKKKFVHMHLSGYEKNHFRHYEKNFG